MFLGILKNTLSGENFHILYTSVEVYLQDTFNPHIETEQIIDFRVSGKTYTERKENLRKKAIEFSNITFDFLGICPTYEELACVGEWFRTMGKRYGLLKEFKENCIC